MDINIKKKYFCRQEVFDGNIFYCIYYKINFIKDSNEFSEEKFVIKYDTEEKAKFVVKELQLVEDAKRSHPWGF